MNEEHSLKQEPRDVATQQYLIAYIRELEDKIRDLQKRIHEAAHKLESSQNEREYWQNINARQQ
jgi:hypothetical protein